MGQPAKGGHTGQPANRGQDIGQPEQRPGQVGAGTAGLKGLDAEQRGKAAVDTARPMTRARARAEASAKAGAEDLVKQPNEIF